MDVLLDLIEKLAVAPVDLNGKVLRCRFCGATATVGQSVTHTDTCDITVAKRDL